MTIDWNIVLAGLIATTPATITAFAALVQAWKAKNQATETHKSVNSRMDQMLDLNRKEATATATLDEKAAEGARQVQAKAASVPDV